MHRRRFLALTAAAAVGSSLTLPDIAPAAAAVVRRERGLSVLMLGGTGFLGPTIVETFLDRGHQVTLFNRGRTNPHLFAYLEKLRGDREDPNGAGLDALRGRDWDVVVDTWQKGAKCVEDTARLLSGHVGWYSYISSIAVYKSFDKAGMDETAPLSDLNGLPAVRTPEQRYFVRKTMAEKLVRAHFDGAVAVLRSHGMRGVRIAAPGDEPYWPVRIWRGGDVLAPGDGQSFGQFTDTISLCRFLADCAESNVAGILNVMSRPFRLKDYLQAIARVTHARANLTWVVRDTLAKFGIEPYRDLPMWRPEPAGFYRFSADKAMRAGYRQRSLEACAASMLEGYFQRHPKDGFEFGGPGTLSPTREREVLAALRG